VGGDEFSALVAFGPTVAKKTLHALTLPRARPNHPVYKTVNDEQCRILRGAFVAERFRQQL